METLSTKEKKKKALALSKTGLTYKQIAKEMNCSTRTVTRLVRKADNCVLCGKPSKRDSKYCVSCGNISQGKYWTKETIIERFKKWYEENGRIPTHRDLYGTNRTRGIEKRLPNKKIVLSEFGSWNNAIKAAGLTPQPKGNYLWFKLTQQCVEAQSGAKPKS